MVHMSGKSPNWKSTNVAVSFTSAQIAVKTSIGNVMVILRQALYYVILRGIVDKMITISLGLPDDEFLNA